MTTELTIYAEDAIATAVLANAHARLSDLLGSCDPIVTTRAQVRSIADGHRLHLDRMDLLRREILVAVPDGTRGDPGRRLCTLTYPAIVRIGPFEIVGQLHGPPSTDAFALARRRRWVAMTDATVVWFSGGRKHVVAHPTVLLNGDHITTLRPLADEISAMRPVPTAEAAWGVRIGWAFGAPARQLAD